MEEFPGDVMFFSRVWCNFSPVAHYHLGRQFAQLQKRVSSEKKESCNPLNQTEHLPTFRQPTIPVCLPDFLSVQHSF